MNINQMLQQTGAIDAISRELGVDSDTARAGATALLPSILSGFQNPVSVEQQGAPSAPAGFGGLGSLLGTLGGLGGAGLLDDVTSPEPTHVGKGNEILGQLFGSKDGSRAVAASAAAQSGVQPSVLKKMLPVLAMVAAGYVMKNAGNNNGRGSAFAGGGAAESPTSSRPQADTSADILGQLVGAAGKLLGR